ncbi:hypothetical protein FEM48_Zijuj11G0038600 [Ziziphus jujuba var. spinosa]|uniref:ATP-dependent RNA helicase n=1 Tax=Ziziphus jujuba var. spinosa TaxID=714518 RepID=A0A978UGN3_ZIZJJ|nr:hypothetical protein FEM48_Zijuj11G0038600 [Ziziphus jujuba var. spinosa]
MSTSMLRERSRTVSKLLLHSLVLTRQMGGGPRTFPGGVSKWKWKRMHEKRARDKEKRLLEQEKQLYQARIRSQIRAKISGRPDPFPEPGGSSEGPGPMSPNDHIKALADRFMKEGAEDLWNERDGPVKSPPSSTARLSQQRSRSITGPPPPPIDLRKMITERDGNVNLSNSNGNYLRARNYSVQRRNRRNESSSSEDDSDDYDLGSSSNRDFMKPFLQSFVGNRESSNFAKKADDFSMNKKISGKKQRKLWRDGSSSSDGETESDSEEESGKSFGKDLRKMGSSASLGKYDIKIKKRVPLNSFEEEIDFSEQVELIRHQLSQKNLIEKEEENGEEEKESILSDKRFDDCDISPLTVKALSSAGYVHMTRVQEATLSVLLEGKDALVKAKTGTGKTAAFLIPAIETVLKASNSNKIERVPPIYVLILCPTRELASQIAAETNVLVKYHDGIGVQTLVGGTRFKDDQRRLESKPSQIIVATPGRLLDHVENKSGLSVRLMGLKMLVLDEASYLLDLGFRKDIETIVDCLPRRRQSLFFTATIPKEVRRISQLVLNREHAFIDTVGLGCVETHDKVRQSFLVAPHELHFQIVHHLLMKHISLSPDYKVIVFCTSGMVTSLVYLFLREMKMNVKEMHSRKPQLYRTRVSEEFKESKRVILVTSDVSARGMNYPDVTLVIQMGIPFDRQQYVNRLGRTGREGKEGEGILLLAPWEEYFLDELKDLPLEKYILPKLESDTKLKIEDSIAKIDTSVKEAAYHAWLGYYNSIKEIGRDKTALVEQANRFCESIGLQKPPALFRKTALKMGLKDIPGIRIRK